MKIGIDYSMTCPAACAYSPGRVEFWFAHESKYDVLLDNVATAYIAMDDTVSKRAATLAAACCLWLQQFSVTQVGLEDYAFAATGRVFHIGENTGILKHFLDNESLAYTSYPPTVIKEFATGKGNADKPKMTAAFLADYPSAHAWIPHLFPRLKSGASPAKSPLADLADAYWIAKYQFVLDKR